MALGGPELVYLTTPQTGEQRLRFWESELGHGTRLVYVVRNRGDTAIKIGISSNVRRRMDALAGGRPMVLLDVVPGDFALEADLHHRLADAALGGEWFDGSLVPRFLDWLHDFSDRVQSQYEDDGRLPMGAGPARKRLPLPSGGYETKLGHRWRTSRPDRNPPVTVRYVDPSTFDADRQAFEERQRRERRRLLISGRR